MTHICMEKYWEEIYEIKDIFFQGFKKILEKICIR